MKMFLLILCCIILNCAFLEGALEITKHPMNVTVCSGTKANISCGYTGVSDFFNAMPDWRIINRNNNGSVISNVTVSGLDIRSKKFDDLRFTLVRSGNSANGSYLSVGPVDDTYNNTSYQCIFTINDNIIESDTAGTITVIGALSTPVLTYKSTLNEILVSWSPVGSDRVCGRVTYNITVMPSHGMMMMINDTAYNITGLYYNTNYTITVYATNNAGYGEPVMVTVKTMSLPPGAFTCNISSPSFNAIGVSCELLGNLARVNVTLKCTSCTSSSEYHTTVNDRPIVISNLPAGNYTVDVTAVDVNFRIVEVITIVSDNIISTTINTLSTIITTATTTNTLSIITTDTTTNTPIIMATDNTPTTIVTATNNAPTTVPTDTATRTPGPTTESGSNNSGSEGSTSGIIAGVIGGIVAVIVVIIIVMIIILIVVCHRKKGATGYKKETLRRNTLAESDNAHANPTYDCIIKPQLSVTHQTSANGEQHYHNAIVINGVNGIHGGQQQQVPLVEYDDIDNIQNESPQQEHNQYEEINNNKVTDNKEIQQAATAQYIEMDMNEKNEPAATQQKIPVIDYAQVDMSKKRVSQQEHKQTADIECDDTVTESKGTKQAPTAQYSDVDLSKKNESTLQVKPKMVYAQVDKSKKRGSQQEHKPTADLECDDAVTESKATEQVPTAQCADVDLSNTNEPTVTEDETPVMEDSQEDKSEKRIPQEEHTPTEDSEYDDTMTEKKVTKIDYVELQGLPKNTRRFEFNRNPATVYTQVM